MSPPTLPPATVANADNGDDDNHADYVSTTDLEALNRQYPQTSISTSRPNPPPTIHTPERRSYDSNLRPPVEHSPADSTSPIADLGYRESARNSLKPGSVSRPSYMAGRQSLRLQALQSNQQPSSTTTPKTRQRAASTITEDVKDFIKKARREDRRKKLGGGTWKERMGDRLDHWHQKIIVEMIMRQFPLPPSKDGRHIPLNPSSVGDGGLVDERSGKPYVSNFIRSSRYTVYDFIPKQLIFQFSKLGHFYFLVIGILQMIPGLSTIGRWTTIVPLAIFVCLSMAKEGYDDYRRYLLDKGENRSYASILRHGIRKDYHHDEKAAAARRRKREKAAKEGKETSGLFYLVGPLK